MQLHLSQWCCMYMQQCRRRPRIFFAVQTWPLRKTSGDICHMPCLQYIWCEFAEQLLKHSSAVPQFFLIMLLFALLPDGDRCTFTVLLRYIRMNGIATTLRWDGSRKIAIKSLFAANDWLSDNIGFVLWQTFLSAFPNTAYLCRH